jgi:protein-tyrosine-phosphatase
MGKRRILFVCVENSNRSQMAEAMSAGSKPSGVVNRKTIEVMAELGYDLAAHRSKSLKDVEGIEFDAVVTMGCGDACPHVKARRRIDWRIPDPRNLPPAEFRAVRDLVSNEVRRLLEEPQDP